MFRLSKFLVVTPCMLIFRIKISSTLSVDNIFCRCYKPESKNLNSISVNVYLFFSEFSPYMVNALPRNVTCQLSLTSYSYFELFHVNVFMGEVKSTYCPYVVHIFAPKASIQHFKAHKLFYIYIYIYIQCSNIKPFFLYVLHLILRTKINYFPNQHQQNSFTMEMFCVYCEVVTEFIYIYIF